MPTQSRMLNEFVQRLIQEKNFQNLDEEILKQLASDLSERVEDRINATILQNMPPVKLEIFNDLLDSATEGEIQLFCQDNIPNLDEVIAEALVDFRNTYLNL